MNNKRLSINYQMGYSEGYEEGFAQAMKSLEKPQAKTVNIIINLKDIAEVTETEKELEDALNSVKNYKNMLFGGCNDN